MTDSERLARAIDGYEDSGAETFRVMRDEIIRLRASLSPDWYDYFCGHCGKYFRAAYVESPICTHCGRGMGDLSDGTEKFKPPGYR